MNKTKTVTFFQNYGGVLALIVATTAMLGSLYFSEIAGFIPCTLCWYQRILMYPLVLIMAVGVIKQDEYLPSYVLPLSMIGIGVSGYHVLLQNGVFSSPSACAVGVPCGASYVNYLGFITIPVMAFTAFMLITAIMALTYWSFWSDESLADTDEDEDERPIMGESTKQEARKVNWKMVPGMGVVFLILMFALVAFRSNTSSDSSQILTLGNFVGPQLDESPMSPGEVLFKQATHGNAPGCLACHSLEAGVTLVGPSLAGVAQRTIDRQPDQAVAAYLRESIVNPDGYTVDGYTAGVMYQQYEDALTEDQIDDLVAFMLTLR